MDIGVGEILYLVAVALLWFRVGYYFDYRRDSEARKVQSAKWRKPMLRALVVCWGMLLLLWNASTLDNAFPVLFLGGRLFRTDAVIVRTLFLLWSAILIVFPGLKLARDIRRSWST